eukprot:scaffold315_cov100-Skeletonema_dohrnii-CCMP3373.AAC.4
MVVVRAHLRGLWSCALRAEIEGENISFGDPMRSPHGFGCTNSVAGPTVLYALDGRLGESTSREGRRKQEAKKVRRRPNDTTESHSW